MSRRLSFVLLGDGAWAATSLRRLAAAGHRPLAVVARARTADESLPAAAADLGLPVWRPQRVNAPEFVAQLRDRGPDLTLSVAYNQILRRPVIEAAPLGCVNVHAGKLPLYRGRNIINWALINGESEVGLTAHFVDEGIDTGPILIQRTLPVAWADTYGDVLARVVAAVPDLVLEAVELLAGGEARPLPQAHLPGSYFCGREDGDEWLDWSDTSRNLYNKIRAITRPAPGARTLLGAVPVTIWRASYDPAWPRYIATPGQVVGRHAGGVLVKTGDSTLLVEEVETQGGGPRRPEWPVGTRLGLNLAAQVQALLARVAALEARAAKEGGDDGT